MNGINVLDWTWWPFLFLYAILFLAALLAGKLIASWLRPDGAAAVVSAEIELAVMANGRERLSESLVARMLSRGSLQMKGKKIEVVPGHNPGDATESAIMALPPPMSWSRLRRAIDGFAADVDGQLVRRGMLQDVAEARWRGLICALPLIALFLLGMAKYLVGTSREMPVGILVFFMMVTVVAILIRWLAPNRLTRAGIGALSEAKAKFRRLEMAHTDPETGMAVALFGTAVLATSPLGDFHRMRASTTGGSSDGSSNDGGGNDDGGDSDGSGCGGGCGGCGG